MKKLVLALAMFTAAPALACSEADFVTVMGDEVTISTSGISYVPNCLKVHRGTKVTIVASSHHPLQGVQLSNGPMNPFVSVSGSTAPQSHTLRETGDLPFFCVRHGTANGGGMAGMIRVE